VLEQEFSVRAPSLRVTEGLIPVTAEDLAGADREEVTFQDGRKHLPIVTLCRVA